MRSADRAQARRQLDKRLRDLQGNEAFVRPPRGWVKAIREALGMTTAQLGRRLGVSQPRVVEIEKAEKTGAITLESLERAANALDCQLVYAFVPRKPLQTLITDRAHLIAKKRLAITGHHMTLEAQAVSDGDEREQFEDLVQQILEKAGSDLWKEDHD